MYIQPSASVWKFEGPSTNPDVEAFHRRLPDYGVTPLVNLLDVANELQVGYVFIKDESSRLGLPAFKILGASWAIHKAIAASCSLPLSTSLEELGVAARTQNIKLVTCTEGNWGRAVARMAKCLHISAIIFVPNSMDQVTQDKISNEGAQTVVVDGDYDVSIQAAREEATKSNGLLVMDVSWEGYEEIPQV